MQKKNLIVLDTNAFIRFLIGDDEENYKKSIQLFADIESEKINALLLESVFAEIVFVLEKVYQVEREIIANHLSAIISLRGVRFNKKNVLFKALEIYKENKIDIVDSILTAYCILDGINIYSFDKKLLKVINKNL